MKRLLKIPTILGAIVLALSLGWAGPSEAGGRGHHKHHGHGRHHGGHGYYGHGDHYDYDKYYYGALLAYGAPLLIGALTGGLHSHGHTASQAPATGYVQQQSGYWYYCTNPVGYYPYVKTCPQGWMQVVPSTPPGRP